MEKQHFLHQARKTSFRSAVKKEQCREWGVCVGAGAHVYLHTQAWEDRPGKSTHTSEPQAFSKPVWTKINQICWESVLHTHLSKNPSQDHGSWLSWRGRLLSRRPHGSELGTEKAQSADGTAEQRQRQLALPGRLGRLVSGEPSDCFPDTLSSAPTHHPVICICSFASYMKV